MPFALAIAQSLCVFLFSAVDLPPAPPKADYDLLDTFSYASPEALRAAWRPMYGCGDAEVVKLGGTPALKLPCRFKGTKFDRGCWDKTGQLDLSDARGLELQVFCPDLEPISYCTVYLQSGSGWYSYAFVPEPAGSWNRIIIDKRKMHPEGTPAGWNRIQTIRLSAWRHQDVDTVVYVANLGLLDSHAPIAVVLAGTDAEPRWLNAAMERLRLPYMVYRDTQLTARGLEGRQLVILPGRVSKAARSVLGGFTSAGGKVLAFRADAELSAAVGAGNVVQAAGDTSDWRTLLKGVVEAAPALSKSVAERAIARVGPVGPYRSYEEATAALSSRPAAELMKAAADARADAEARLARGEYVPAIEAAEVAGRKLREAYCSAQQPAAGEHRAFWCHEASGVKGMSWDAAIKILADNGFNVIHPNMLWGGVAYYPSSVLPVWPEVAEKGDQIELCLAACRKYGVQCHPWKVNWNMSMRTPQEFRDRMKAEGRTQVKFDGTLHDLWLCPSNPANQQLEIDAMVEVAKKYDVDGVHFDYIRYPDLDSCYCAHCRERFERAVGEKIEKWPQDVRQEGELRQKWLDWRRGHITRVVAGVAEIVHKTRPKCRVSAAVFPNYPRDRDIVCQDWKLWCEKGYLDFVCPMDYRTSNRQFEALVRDQLVWAGKVPCYPGIGLSVWPDRTDVPKLIDQINITRRHKTGGFTVFNYADVEAEHVLPLCGMGITRK